MTKNEDLLIRLALQIGEDGMREAATCLLVSGHHLGNKMAFLADVVASVERQRAAEAAYVAATRFVDPLR